MRKKQYIAIILLMLICSGSAETKPEEYSYGNRIVEVNGQYCLYSQKGERISGLYDSIEPFWDDTTVVSLDGRFGLLDKEGKEVLPTMTILIAANATGSSRSVLSAFLKRFQK